MSLSLPLSAQLENSLPVSGPGLGSGSGPGCHGNVLPDRSDRPPEKSINATLMVAGNFVKAFCDFTCLLFFPFFRNPVMKYDGR